MMSGWSTTAFGSTSGTGRRLRGATFDEVARLLAGGLPSSAYRHSAWWANDDSHVQAAGWRAAGWRTEDVHLNSRVVTFEPL